jgi:transposase
VPGADPSPAARYLPTAAGRVGPTVQLGQTLASWSQEIVAMWRFTRNNGITEGFHNKMELINRQAYGFRNFENYRLRVKVLCG